ncbi:MAG: ABC transporter ATP-binding protein [Burkholderiales bacterium]|nr:ABC transporter ATP-binding protein [Burkholderiales bacterium]OJX03160.1 MAG: sulfonate ABC transporter ATP-binding protein [Burkholderiales bacterium 70-64]
MTRTATLTLERVERMFDAVQPGGVPFKALEGIDLVVEPAQIVSLVGPSGCGKSTLLRMVAGFDRPSAGVIRLDDRPIGEPGADRGVVFQQPQLYPWLNVRENVVFGPKKRGVDKARYEADARRYIEAVGLAGFERHYPYQLSGGMRQRLQIARVLINEPSILLMDEPFGALDYQTRLDMQRLLLELSERYRPTVLFITHDIEEAVFISDRVHVMSARPGRIVESLEVDLPRPRVYEEVSVTETFMRLKLRVLAHLKG